MNERVHSQRKKKFVPQIIAQDGELWKILTNPKGLYDITYADPTGTQFESGYKLSTAIIRIIIIMTHMGIYKNERIEK